MKTLSYSFYPLFFLILSLTIGGCSQNENDKNFSSLVKVALRNTGNSLLLQNNDSISLVSPVIETEKKKFQLSFQPKLSITPDSLVKAIGTNLEALDLPNEYLVEVIDCSNQQVSYSYSVSGSKEKNIIPCLGRNLPLRCYSINVSFNKSTALMGLDLGWSWYALTLISIMGIALLFWTKKRQETKTYDTSSFETIGDYKFYKNQNELVKDNLSIQLTAKESEVLQILNKNQNQIVKRNFLLKEIWEDKGVFVGRSLDTFISKLRKRFKDDSHINIINVHGVGYKLEIEKNLRK